MGVIKAELARLPITRAEHEALAGEIMNHQDSNFDVAGMSCGSCVRHIEHALREVPGVQRVEVDLRAGLVRVEHDADLASVDQLLAGIADAGYEAKSRSPA